MSDQGARTYNIIRFFKDDSRRSKVIKRHLTREEALAHCKNPETSSSTCTRPDRRNITVIYGDWFDGYHSDDEEDSNC